MSVWHKIIQVCYLLFQIFSGLRNHIIVEQFLRSIFVSDQGVY